ncbi:glycosyltransferase family 4 protein [Nocardia sp. NPDC004068]|uniref:glycosyltransferase family 4 protein n=1 Tax=Nocardia sp. NPDC004068 TaxID=3364303 RepID=UPI0036A4E0EA
MHIALVHRDLHQRTRGGICTLYRALATRLAAHGHRLTLITQATPHPVVVDGARVISLRRTDDPSAHRAAVAAALQQLRPDVVDCSTWEAETLAYLNIPRGDRAPVLVRGEFSAATLGAPELAAAEQQLVQCAERVIAVSHYAARDLAEAYGVEPLEVVYNGIDHYRFHPGRPTPPESGVRVRVTGDGQLVDAHPIPALLAADEHVPPFTADPFGRVRLVWVGKLTPMKGWDVLEQLAARLQHLATITAVLGHSTAFSPITKRANGLTLLHDLDDTDMPRLYRCADWFLSTSRWEGFGLAITEAIACGTPVLLPEQLAVAPELLTTGAGYTYTDADHLAELLATRTLPPAVPAAQFDWDRNAASTLGHYQQLIRV